MSRREVTAEEIRTIKCDVDEQETTYQFSREDTSVSMYTSDNTVLTKMRKLVDKYPEVFKCYMESSPDGEPQGYFFSFPKKLLNMRKPNSAPKNPLTDEERRLRGERLKQGRNRSIN